MSAQIAKDRQITHPEVYRDFRRELIARVKEFNFKNMSFDWSTELESCKIEYDGFKKRLSINKSETPGSWQDFSF